MAVNSLLSTLALRIAKMCALWPLILHLIDQDAAHAHPEAVSHQFLQYVLFT